MISRRCREHETDTVGHHEQFCNTCSLCNQFILIQLPSIIAYISFLLLRLIIRLWHCNLWCLSLTIFSVVLWLFLILTFTFAFFTVFLFMLFLLVLSLTLPMLLWRRWWWLWYLLFACFDFITFSCICDYLVWLYIIVNFCINDTLMLHVHIAIMISYIYLLRWLVFFIFENVTIRFTIRIVIVLLHIRYIMAIMICSTCHRWHRWCIVILLILLLLLLHR